MTDKVQKIREEVEKLHGNPYYMMAVKDVLEILDMQEKPVSIWHDVSEEPEPNMELICVGQYGNPLVLSSNSDSFKSRDISKWAYFNDLLNLSNIERTVKNWKDPVSEDLEEAIDTYLATYFSGEKEKQEWPFLKKMAIYFAEWQKRRIVKEIKRRLVDAATNQDNSADIGEQTYYNGMVDAFGKLRDKFMED